MSDEIFSDDVWTEVELTSECYNPYIVEPFFDEDAAQFFLCRKEQEKKPVRMSMVVFRKYGTEEWEDDIMDGVIEAQALGSGSEEPQPVLLYNIGVSPKDFVQVVSQNGGSLTFAVNYEDGEVEIEGATKVAEGFRVNREQLMNEGTFEMKLTPEDGSAPFTLHLSLPYLGMTIRDGEGNPVSGELNVPFMDIMNYTYTFKGNVDDDRFTISFNNDKIIYVYILTENGKLSIRSKKDHMDKVGETDAEGRLALLLQGIPNAVIKHKEQRWRITVTD